MSIQQKFFKYVSQNILAMLGMSCYILADTYFISKAVGANGITALNLVLPLYSLIFAIGAMIGVGSAIRFSIAKAQKDRSMSLYFSTALSFGTAIGLLFSFVGIFFPAKLLALLGGDAEILMVGTNYTRIFMIFAPCFIWNHIFNAFVRNDGNPSLSMTATLSSSIFNIFMDYFLMFPLGMGMTGAALATAISPLVGAGICLLHFLNTNNSISFQLAFPDFRLLIRSCQVGISAFVGEMSSGVITIVFNMIILHLAGNIGVAAYGVVANSALVAVAIFNGIFQGTQPLLSEFYGKREYSSIRSVLKLGLFTSLLFALGILVLIFSQAATITSVFNGEGNSTLALYAEKGLKIYFLGFIFAGFNIVGTGALSSIESTKWAFLISMLRGFVIIIICAFLFSHFFGMTGVWMAFPIAEGLTSILTFYGLYQSLRRIITTRPTGGLL